MPRPSQRKPKIDPDLVRQRIKESRWTFSEIAKRVPIDPSQLSRFYRNERMLSQLAYDRLCEVLDLQPTQEPRATANLPTLGGDWLWHDEAVWQEFLAKLDEDDSRLLRWFFEGETFAEIGQRAKWTEEEVRVLFRRMLRSFRAVLQERDKTRVSSPDPNLEDNH